MRTADAARALSVNPSTLQRWAQQGLVTPKMRTAGGQARWDLDDLREQVRQLAENRGQDDA